MKHIAKIVAAFMLVMGVFSCESSDVTVSGVGETEGEIVNPGEGSVMGEYVASIVSDISHVALAGNENIDVPVKVTLDRIARQDMDFAIKIESDAIEGISFEVPSRIVSVKAGSNEGAATIKIIGKGYDENIARTIKITLSSSAVTVDENNKSVSLHVEKPARSFPGILGYPKISFKYFVTAYCSRVSVGGVAFERLYYTQDGNIDYSDKYVACITRGIENEIIIEADRAGANAEFRKYTFRIMAFADWTGDGDFNDPGEVLGAESWSVQQGEHYRTFSFKFTPPEDAVKSARIRLGIYEDNSDVSNMQYGAGSVGSCNFIDISYLLVDEPVKMKPLDAADRQQFDTYCIPQESVYSYAEMRTYVLNGETIIKSQKGDPIDKLGYTADGKWDSRGYNIDLAKVVRLKRNEVNVFEFTAERHIDYYGCDQRYNAFVFIDWYDNKDFQDYGEEILREEWLCEWLDRSHPTKFLAYIIPPADAAEKGRLRFGVHGNRQSYVKHGCGGGNNFDMLDISYELVD